MRILILFSGKLRNFRESMSVHIHTFSFLNKKYGYDIDILISTWKTEETEDQILDQCKNWDIGDIFIDFVDEDVMLDDRVKQHRDRNDFRSTVCRGAALEKVSNLEKAYDTVICTRNDFVNFHINGHTWMTDSILETREKFLTFYGSEFRYKGIWDEFVDDNFIIIPAELCYSLKGSLLDITYNSIVNYQSDKENLVAAHFFCYQMFTNFLIEKNDFDYRIRRRIWKELPFVVRHPDTISKLINDYTEENFNNAFLLNQK